MGYQPDYIVRPGEILEETLDARDILKREFAELCGLSAKCISQIIAGKAPISVKTALKFEEILGVSAQLWMNLETRYRIKIAKEER